mmetsp:Transcript_28780/g.52079  ORF Transcript_28780/g.52079 Transcript_28780/m.52079 type:complete len:85 (+) Transcript_28780:112-366(+)
MLASSNDVMDNILALLLSAVEGTNPASSLLVSNSDVRDISDADLVVLEKFIVDVLLQVCKTQKQSLFFMCLCSVYSAVCEMEIM